jgi:hypothetical protein
LPELADARSRKPANAALLIEESCRENSDRKAWTARAQNQGDEVGIAHLVDPDRDRTFPRAGPRFRMAHETSLFHGACQRGRVESVGDCAACPVAEKV